MKIVDVTQWVEIPLDPSLASRSIAEPKCDRRNGGVRSRGKARAQAASLNSEKCIVVVKG